MNAVNMLQNIELKPKLAFFRCLTCLEVFTTNEVNKVDECACGGTRIEYMGRAFGARIKKEEEHCACDARCTNAMGPSCNCVCAGANHGTGKTVTVLVDNGKAKVTGGMDKAKERANAWLAALADAEKRLQEKHGSALDAIRAGTFIDRTIYFAAVKAARELLAIRKVKVYKSRQTKIVAFLAAV